MTNNPRYASLYQINTRVWLTELSHALGRAATLDDIPDAELDRIAALGFDWMWFLSVWQTGPAAQRAAADIQSLADLTNSFEVARTMQAIAPITRDRITSPGCCDARPCCAIGTHHDAQRKPRTTEMRILNFSFRTCVLLLDQGPMVRLPFLMVHLQKIQIEGTSNTRILDSVCSS